MNSHEDIRVKSSSGNICYVVDGNGKHWICPVGVDTDGNLDNQACFPADEMIYDRMFGG